MTRHHVDTSRPLSAREAWDVIESRKPPKPIPERHRQNWSDAEVFAAILATVAVTRAYTGVNSATDSAIVGALEIAVGYGVLCLRDAVIRHFEARRNRKARQRLATGAQRHEG